jgi:hypothetical protein
MIATRATSHNWKKEKRKKKKTLKLIDNQN